MTPTKIVGKFIFTLIFLLVVSIAAKPQKYNYRLVHDDQLFCIYDSLKFSIPFPSWFVNFQPSSESTQMGSIKNKLGLYSWNCIGSFKTGNSDLPHYECYLFLAKNGVVNDKRLHEDVHKLFLTTEHDPFCVDSTNNQIIQILKLEQDTLLFLGLSDKGNFSKFKDIHFNKILNGIKKGFEYKNIAIANPFDVYRRVIFEPDSTLSYEKPYLALRDREQNYEDNRSKIYYAQAFYTALANFTNIENYKSAYLSTASDYFPRSVAPASVICNDSSALDFIVNQCVNRRIVMLNENHYLRNGRLMGHLLMKRLVALGFKYFAFECIWDEKSLRGKHFPTTSTGFYSNEPMMANLIHEAINSGYFVFGYDSDSLERDRYAALNIYSKVFAHDTSAKVFVFAGFGHISKQINKKTLANELKKLTNYNPLCINQTDFQYNSNHWLSIIDSSKVSVKYYTTADIYISNQLSYEKFAEMMQYSCYQIPRFKINLKGSFLISIYNADNFLVEIERRTIPVYNYYSNSVPIEHPFEFQLPIGNYMYILKQSNKEVYSGRLQLKAK